MQRPAAHCREAPRHAPSILFVSLDGDGCPKDVRVACASWQKKRGWATGRVDGRRAMASAAGGDGHPTRSTQPRRMELRAWCVPCPAAGCPSSPSASSRGPALPATDARRFSCQSNIFDYYYRKINCWHLEVQRFLQRREHFSYRSNILDMAAQKTKL